MPHLLQRTSGRTQVRLCLKARDSRVFSCQQTVNCHTAFMLLAFVRTYYGFTAQLFKEGEAHIGKRRFSVHACFLLHYGNKVVESIVLFLRNGDFFFICSSSSTSFVVANLTGSPAALISGSSSVAAECIQR